MPKFIERFPEINSGFMKGCVGILQNLFAILAIKGVLTPPSPPFVFSSASACRLLTALLELGALIGSLIAGFSADKFSRKVTLGLGIFFFVVGSVIQSQSSASHPHSPSLFPPLSPSVWTDGFVLRNFVFSSRFLRLWYPRRWTNSQSSLTLTPL